MKITTAPVSCVWSGPSWNGILMSQSIPPWPRQTMVNSFWSISMCPLFSFSKKEFSSASTIEDFFISSDHSVDERWKDAATLPVPPKFVSLSGTTAWSPEVLASLRPLPLATSLVSLRRGTLDIKIKSVYWIAKGRLGWAKRSPKSDHYNQSPITNR